MDKERAIGQILERQGLLSSGELDEVIEQNRERQTLLTDLVVQQNIASESDVAQALARECGLDYIDTIDAEAVPLEAATRLPISYAKAQKVLLLGSSEEQVELVCADPLNVSALDDIRAMTGAKIHVQVAPASLVVDTINRVYERQDTMGEDLESEEDIQEDGQGDLLDSDEDAPIIRWVNALFSQSV
ncbi:MAG: type II secretion system protein GspE, partial [Polyangiaceae bacterium]|nr:type II secretion system protein GspE [Polyangiaceae bacterium]